MVVVVVIVALLTMYAKQTIKCVKKAAATEDVNCANWCCVVRPKSEEEEEKVTPRNSI